MTVNITHIRAHIQDFRFEDLFIEELGWDQYRDRLEVTVNGDSVTLMAFAQKRGMVAFIVTAIPEYKLRRKIEQQVAKFHRENIIIYTDQTQQIWQWVRRETGKPLANRERQFTRGQSGDSIAQILAGIAFSLDEEDNLTIVDVTSRVRAAFDMERVTRRFYDRFKRQHDAFLAFINGVPDDDLQRWYASVMLNRLMFIYFVQKKGFLDGDTDYLRTRLARTGAGGNFYRDFLRVLFFDGLAKTARPPHIRNLLGDVPYLNGGLFLPHQIEDMYGDAIQIENAAFEKLFDFFDEYHWHLDDRPLRADNEINPDVLGYIFEKYINQKQMGAYYTKEDITEYISKNTVIPFLFDQVRQDVSIAFDGARTVWDLLADNPDRYIYPAVRHGYYEDTPRPEGEGFRVRALPHNIAAGLDDVSQRTDWNTPAPPEYALPTEIWREVVARRQRYEDVRGKLTRGEIHSINDLITLNLDIQQFAQDVIDFTDSPDVIRAFWKALNAVTVLDPTCGSGAFLFAALNILEPLYEACLERMEAFLAEYARTTLTPDPSPSGRGEKTHPQRYTDFREVMARIDQHPNRRYFVFKSIIVNNLYGVDIMEEAIEIAKLRLFLKLVAQVDDKRRVEPLPDIDFNIRAGNTLVGFATEAEFRGRLFAQTVLSRMETLKGTVDSFREAQLRENVAPETLHTLKDNVNRKLKELTDLLDTNLMEDYGQSDLVAFRRTHRPFHWFVEFYGVMKRGGFDVIIGNPPYVEYSKVKKDYNLINYQTKGNNIYSYCMERAYTILTGNGFFGMIIPVSLTSLEGNADLRTLINKTLKSSWISGYAVRPSKLFEGVDQRLIIHIAQKSVVTISNTFSAKYQRWSVEERDNLFKVFSYISVNEIIKNTRIPKCGDFRAKSIMDKLCSNKISLLSLTKNKGAYIIHYHRSPNYWIRAMDFEPHFKSATKNKSHHHIRELYFEDSKIGKIVGAIINSSLFFLWFDLYGNNRNIAGIDIEDFTLRRLDDKIFPELISLFDKLMIDYRHNSEVIKRKDTELEQFYPRLSKPIIDEIDRVLARHYGFTDEELDFIINYDIKYRMGDDLGGEEGEE